jgi:O-acetylserine/cysteine efflux transporter
LPLNHILLALAVVFVWGTNFVVIRLGLDAMPPFLFATLRFALSALPWLFFLPRPAAPWSRMAAFGVLLGVGQFGLLFLAMRSNISPGLASLVVQLQVFFTIGLSLLLMGEKVRGYQIAGLLLALAGLGVIGAHLNATVTLLGLCLVLMAGFFWACANLVVKSIGRVNMLHFVVWSSAFAVPPLFALSWLLEGPPSAMLQTLQQTSAIAWAAVLWQAVGNSLFGFGVWNWLLSHHPAAQVTPMALLVPVFGMSASALALGEPLPAWKLGAGALVMAGLAVIVLWPRFTRARQAVPAAP